MNGGRCHREDELLEALQRGFLPAELATHAGGCTSCAELHRVAGALLDDRAHAVAEAPVPSGAAMWWRIQLRQRQEANAASRRSLLAGQAATLGVALLLVAAFLGVDLASGMRHVASAISMSMPLLVGVAIWLVLAPLLGWAVIRQK